MFCVRVCVWVRRARRCVLFYCDRVYGREFVPPCMRVVRVDLPRISETSKGAGLRFSFISYISCIAVHGASVLRRLFRRYVAWLLLVVNEPKDRNLRRHWEAPVLISMLNSRNNLKTTWYPAVLLQLPYRIFWVHIMRVKWKNVCTKVCRNVSVWWHYLSSRKGVALRNCLRNRKVWPLGN